MIFLAVLVGLSGCEIWLRVADIVAPYCYGSRDVKFGAVFLRWSACEIWRRVATVVGV